MNPVKTASRVIVFICSWHPHSSQDEAGRQGRAQPPDVFPIRVPCLGRISPGLILKAYQQGAAGVCLLGCPEDRCRFQTGNSQVGEVVQQARELLKLLGYNEETLQVQLIPAGDGKGYSEVLDRMLEQITAARKKT